MPAGRPSKYRPEFCQQLIDHMNEGYSFESFAGPISVDRDTLYEWAKVYQEFSDAKKVGSSKSLYIWEDLGIKGTKGKIRNFNSGTWIFNMKNRFRWTDRETVAIEDIRPVVIEKRNGEEVIVKMEKEKK